MKSKLTKKDYDKLRNLFDEIGDAYAEYYLGKRKLDDAEKTIEHM